VDFEGQCYGLIESLCSIDYFNETLVHKSKIPEDLFCRKACKNPAIYARFLAYETTPEGYAFGGLRALLEMHLSASATILFFRTVAMVLT
jgi:hypothetical protein